MTGKSDLIGWISICKSVGLMNSHALKLYNKFHSPSEILTQTKKELMQEKYLDEKKIKDLVNGTHSVFAEEVLNNCESNNIQIIGIFDSRFPALLREVNPPPPILFFKGQWTVMKNRKVSIVGSRKASDDAIDWTRNVAEQLAKNGFTIVSGGAKGIDEAAHYGALDADEGSTIAVLGSGLLHPIPKIRSGIISRIEERGLLLSPYFPNDRPTAFMLLNRNRITSGLSSTILVVVSDVKGGSMSQIDHAERQGRRILCPLEAFEPRSGIERLLLDKRAYPVSNVSDILSCLDNSNLTTQNALFSYSQ